MARKKKLPLLRRLPSLLSQHLLLPLLHLLQLLLTLPLLQLPQPLPTNWQLGSKKATFGWLFFGSESQILICVNQLFEVCRI